ncbi:hypothetical protein HRbin33_02114 [bacterium HR33]|nr:hypothetical protein HRbin33_02114 [bacterium HR33]
MFRREGKGPQALIPGEGNSPVVEVLNTTRTDGLAREVTRRLRRAGIDVVYYGTDWSRAVDSTTILVRSPDSAAALRVRSALGFGRLLWEPDPKLLLDATVLLGPDAASALHLHP